MLDWLKKRESGALGNFSDLALGVVTVIIIIALGFLVLAQFQTTNVNSFSNNTNVYSAILNGYTNLTTLSNFVAVVVIVGVVALIVTMIGRALGGGMSGGQM